MNEANKPTAYIIRKAEPTDALGIATVHVKTWQCAYKGQIPDSYLDNLSIEKRRKTWNESLKKKEEGRHPIVAISENKIVGVILEKAVMKMFLMRLANCMAYMSPQNTLDKV